MENLSNIQKNEITKKEFEYEKEKCRLNLRKNKLAEILSSKRRKIINNENDKKIKNYSIQLEDIINNIPNEYKIDINLFLDNVRIFILFYFYIQFNLSSLKDYLKSSNIYFNLYGVYIIKQYLSKNNYNEDFINALNKQIDDEFLSLISLLLNKDNKKMSFEILIILINVTQTKEGEMLFGNEQNVVENIFNFINKNKKDIILIEFSLMLIKHITSKNSLVKQILYNCKILDLFNEIYQMYLLNSDIIDHLILCLGHFINSRFSNNKNMLFSIKIIKSQLNNNTNFHRLLTYIYILYNLVYYHNPEIIKKMIDEEIHKSLMDIFPFDDISLTSFNKNSKNNNINDININDEEEFKKKFRKFRLIIIKILENILTLEEHEYIQKIIDSGIAQFINRLLQLSDIKIIKNTFNCIFMICYGTFGHISNLYENNTISLALKVSKNIYEAFNSQNQFINNISKEDFIGALKEISKAFSLLIKNSLHEQLVPIIKYEKGFILLLLKDSLKIFQDIPDNDDLITFICQAFYKLLKSSDFNIKEFLLKNGFKEILEKLQINQNEDIVKTAEIIYDEYFEDFEDNSNSNNININDIIDDCECNDDE